MVPWWWRVTEDASYELVTTLVRRSVIGYNGRMQRPVLAAGAAVGAFLLWRRLRGRSRSAELVPGLVIDSSKARALFDLGREAARAGVEQALSSRLDRAA